MCIIAYIHYGDQGVLYCTGSVIKDKEHVKMIHQKLLNSAKLLSYNFLSPVLDPLSSFKYVEI